VALLAEILEHAGLLHLALELLERPVEAVGFVESDFDHQKTLERVVVVRNSKRKSRADAIGPAPHFTGNCRSRTRV
jgi:hypothetical protein